MTSASPSCVQGPNADATSVLADLGGDPPGADDVWAVWAA